MVSERYVQPKPQWLGGLRLIYGSTTARDERHRRLDSASRSRRTRLSVALGSVTLTLATGYSYQYLLHGGPGAVGGCRGGGRTPLTVLLHLVGQPTRLTFRVDGGNIRVRERGLVLIRRGLLNWSMPP